MVKSIENYQISEDALNLVNLMKTTLSEVEGIYEKYNVPLPARRYWAMARPAEDCEQVVVSFLQMYLGAPGDQANLPQHCNVAPRSAVLEISITRCYPVGINGKEVPVGQIEDASEWGAIDAWVLMDSLPVFDNFGGLGAGPGIIATITVNEPSGGLQSTIMNLTVAVP